MALPTPIKDVPRDRVHAVVKAMLLSPDVAHLSCREGKDGTYTVTPRPRSSRPK